MQGNASFVLTTFLVTLLGACVASGPSSKAVQPKEEKSSLSNLSRSEADLVFGAVKADHLKYGTEARFDQLVKKSRIAIQKCSDRYILEFSPKDFYGLDGGTSVTVDRGTFQIDYSYYLPTSCGPYFDYHVVRKSNKNFTDTL